MSHVVHGEFSDTSCSQKLSPVEIHFSVIWSLYNVICAHLRLRKICYLGKPGDKQINGFHFALGVSDRVRDYWMSDSF